MDILLHAIWFVEAEYAVGRTEWMKVLIRSKLAWNQFDDQAHVLCIIRGKILLCDDTAATQTWSKGSFCLCNKTDAFVHHKLEPVDSSQIIR